VHRNRIADMQLRGNTRPLPVRVYWPGQPTPDPAPLLVFCIAGTGAETSCRTLSSAAGLVVLSVDDSASGPAGGPAGGPHDGTIVLEWAGEHAAELSADPRRLLVAGEDAGAAVAATVALEICEQGWPLLTRQVLINPGPISGPVVAGIAPATIVTVQGHPHGDRYAARLRQAGITVDELHYSVDDLATGRMLADLGQALRRTLAEPIARPGDESARPGTSFS
jgi:acetyl esterase/lipase